MALHDVGFTVNRGEIFGLLGPNGGGKTTLFRILSTLLPPQKGRARILGDDLVEHRQHVRRALGVVFQSPALDRKLKVQENLRCQGHLYGMRGAALRQRIDEMLGRFGLADRAGDLVEKLSGGLRRRVELAKALLHSPEVLILDEPSTGLDPGARLDLWRNLEEIRRERGVTVLLTSHILEEVERCDRVAILDRGHLLTHGAPQALKESVGDDVITIASPAPDKLAAAIAARFGLQPRVLDTSVRLEQAGGTDLLRRLVETFPDEIRAVTLSKPTLEDVFIQCTGHFFEGGASAPLEAPLAASAAKAHTRSS
jgi:ABC-2 type transport system ATP-binding protein